MPRKAASSLGRSLVKSRNKKKNNRRERLADRKARASGRDVSGNYTDYGGMSGLTSVTELNSLDEFISHARMADRQFSTERNNITVVEDSMIGGTSAALGRASAVGEAGKSEGTEVSVENLKIPRRPAWDKTTTKEQLDKAEREAFLSWRRNIAAKEEKMRLRDGTKSVVTPFEKNIEFWRQLWRVMERSDLIVQIVDARNPLMFYCPDVDAYTHELEERMGRNKKTLLLVNKADFLSPQLRKAWVEYFGSKNIEFLFFSAKIQQHLLDAEAASEGGSGAPAESLPAAANASEVIPSAPAATGHMPIPPNKADLAYEDRPAEWVDQGLPDEARLIDRHALVERLSSLSLEVANSNGETEKATVGMIGYPNVGKSSVINVVLGVTARTHTKKRVAVGSTPGKTKHFQTLNLSERLTLCDCPGLVFPSFVNSKAEMVCNGVLPIHQLRDYMSPITLLCKRIHPDILESACKIKLPRSVINGKRLPFGARDLLQLYSSRRGYMRSGHSGPDESRGARELLKNYVAGKLLFCHWPPGMRDTVQHHNTSKAFVPNANNGTGSVSSAPQLVVGGVFVPPTGLDHTMGGVVGANEAARAEQSEVGIHKSESGQNTNTTLASEEEGISSSLVGKDSSDDFMVSKDVSNDSGAAANASPLAEDDFDDDFFTIEGEETELVGAFVKKSHRSKRRDRRGKHKARRAKDAEFPTPYDTATSRNGGEDVYGLASLQQKGVGYKIAGGKKKINRKHPRNRQGQVG